MSRNRVGHSWLIFFLFLHWQAAAQLCGGSLGDAVVNINFGTGAAPASYTAPGYQYTTSSCPDDGYFSITTNQSSCGRQWHTVSRDHTGGGAFMMVNASNTPGDFFVQTITNLCPNTTYEFSAWVLNVVNNPALIKPNLTFRIETTNGTVLSEYATGDIQVYSQPTWQSVGFYFTNGPASQAVVLRISNNAPGGQGNDLALDDISFRPCGPAITVATSEGVDTIRSCIADQRNYLLFAQVANGYVQPAYQWQMSIDSGTSWTDIAGERSLQYMRSPSAAGLFLYRLSVAETSFLGIVSCRIYSKMLRVEVAPTPVVNAGPDRVKLPGFPVQLSGQTNVITGATYTWTPVTGLNNAAVLAPIADPLQTTTYTLNVISQQGCSGSDQVKVEVVQGLFIPTAFTPNGDGKNDRWVITNLDPSLGATVTIFDRAGQQVYQQKGDIVSWDGQYKGVSLPAGVYVYLVLFPQGPQRKGTLLLIR